MSYIPHINPLGNTLNKLKPGQKIRMTVKEYPYNQSVQTYIGNFFKDRKSDKKFKVKFLNRDKGYTILRTK